MRPPDFGELVADSRSASSSSGTARPCGEPVIDATRVALMGELIGLVAATLATLAMVRRPPWPDLTRPK